MRISLNQAIHFIKQGDVIAVPTETVYGLAASYTQPEAVEKVFSIKGRPSNNPLILHLSDFDQIEQFSQQKVPFLKELAQTFWPGPLTIVMPIDPKTIPGKVRAGLQTAAFRVPNHPLARQLLKETGPLVMPSANLSGRPSATSAAHVEYDFGSDFPVLDGGQCTLGLESTILYDKDGIWQVVRQGAIAPDAFKKVLGYIPLVAHLQKDKAPLCPGQLYRHYAPQAKLILLKEIPYDLTGVLLGFSDRQYPQKCHVLKLGLSSDPVSVAHNLYGALRQLDEEGHAQAYVDINFPQDHLWSTIYERLTKAASPDKSI